MHKQQSKLNPRQKYLQVALNGSLADARAIIGVLPTSDRIILEVGTPLMKLEGMRAVRQVADWYRQQVIGLPVGIEAVTPDEYLDELGIAGKIISSLVKQQRRKKKGLSVIPFEPYIVADMKTIDRGEVEVAMAAEAGASAVVAMGSAPVETLNTFITACTAHNVDAMVDMMNVPNPVAVLRALKDLPAVVILHRGVDEERDNREKQLPLYDIQRIKGAFDILVAVAGGDTIREVQRSFFNAADIAVVWKDFYAVSGETAKLAEEFLKEVK